MVREVMIVSAFARILETVDGPFELTGDSSAAFAPERSVMQGTPQFDNSQPRTSTPAKSNVPVKEPNDPQ